MAALASDFGRTVSVFDRYAPACLRIRNKRGRVIRLNLSQVQRMVLADKRRAIAAGRRKRFLILKYRRGGVTTLEQAVSFHQVATYKGQQALTLAHDFPSTVKIFRMVDLFYRELKAAAPALCPRRTSTNQRELDLPDMGSLFYIGTAGSSGLGRGDTLQRVHWSEVAWSMRIHQGLLSGLTEACSEGSITLESTANGPGGLFYELAREAFERPQLSEWTGLFYPWFVDPANTMDPGKVPIIPGVPHSEDFPHDFCTGEVDLIEMAARRHGVTITPGQLLWRRTRWYGTKPNPDLFAQEYPETWQGAFVASATLRFRPSWISAGAARAREPLGREDNGRFLWWSEPVEGRLYVAGADPAEGIPGADRSYLTIHDAETGEQVARWHGYASPAVFGGEIIPRYCRRYGSARVAIERNNHGHAVILAARTAGYYQLWKRKKLKPGVPRELQYGWETNGQTRDLLLDGLAEGMESGWLVIHDPVFWAECWTFADDGSGKYEAKTGCHDDTVMGAGIALEARRMRRGYDIANLGGPEPEAEGQ